jgi:hypothetical protein
MQGSVGYSMRVPGKVQAGTSFVDDGHGEVAMRFARKSRNLLRLYKFNYPKICIDTGSNILLIM